MATHRPRRVVEIDELIGIGIIARGHVAKGGKILELGELLAGYVEIDPQNRWIVQHCVEGLRNLKKTIPEHVARAAVRTPARIGRQ